MASLRESWVGLISILALLSSSAFAQSLPEGPGKQLFSNVCSACHGVELATEIKLSRADWKAKVDSMVEKGAAASKEEAEAIVAYLAKNFGADDSAPKPPAGPSTAMAASPAAKAMPEGAGKQIILRECTACHLPDHFTKYQHTNEEWQAIVIRMGQRVRSATREELDTVQKYLAANFPEVQDTTKVNINRATAKEIETRLALSPEEAQAIVQYRERHGEFRDWGELLAIYGVDGFKIEASRDRMSF